MLRPPPPNGLGGIRVMGRRSHHNVGLSVVGKWRATSTTSTDGVVELPSRSVARSGLPVRVPYKAACRLIDCPPTEGMTSPSTLTAGIGGVTPGPSGSRDSPGAAWARRTGESTRGLRADVVAEVGMPARGVPDSQSPTGLEPASTVVSLATEVEAAMGTARVAGTDPFSAPDFISHPKIFFVLGKIAPDVLGSGWSAGEETASTPDVALPTP